MPKGIYNGHKANSGSFKKGQTKNPKAYYFPKGEKHPNWKGGNTCYIAMHAWLRINFGKADKCENKNCKIIKPKRFEWALIRGKKHSHNRKNYIQFCISCHRKYDYNGRELTETHKQKIKDGVNKYYTTKISRKSAESLNLI